MKKLLMILLPMLIAAVNIYSQLPVPKPASASFVLAKDEVLTVLPKTPVDSSVVGKDGKKVYDFYRLEDEGVYYFVFAVDPKNEGYLNAIPNYLTEAAPAVEMREHNGLSGYFYRFTDAEGFEHRLWRVAGKNRTYIFHTVAEVPDNPAVVKFFNSVTAADKVFPNTKTETQISKNETRPVTADTPSTENLKTAPQISAPGRGSGIGAGSGSGIGTRTIAPTAPTANGVSPLRILSKPRPNYTDLARLYLIAGVVRLRVTFSADGTIGAISAVKKLPFGLTEQSIIAAKGIAFEPPQKENQKVASTRVVEFNFAIY